MILVWPVLGFMPLAKWVVLWRVAATVFNAKLQIGA